MRHVDLSLSPTTHCLREFEKNNGGCLDFTSYGNRPVRGKQVFSQNSALGTLLQCEALPHCLAWGDESPDSGASNERAHLVNRTVPVTSDFAISSDKFGIDSYSAICNLFRAQAHRRSPVHKKLPQRPQKLTKSLEQKNKWILGRNPMTLAIPK